MIYNFSEDVKNKKIIITPLNWGLGHATRCIPIIRQAISLGAEILLASDGIALDYLRNVFPNLKSFELPTYNVNYKYKSMILNGMIQLPKVLSAIDKESIMIDQIARENNIDLIISDNRYGCHSSMTRNIFITHQLNILHPSFIFSSIVNYQNRKWLNRFDSIWVPDYPDGRLSGTLSNSKLIKGEVKSIGPQSIHKNLLLTPKYDLLFLLSGPEPQRTIFELKLIEIASRLSDMNICFVSGTKKSPINKRDFPDHINYYSTVYGDDLTYLLNQSEIVISRSGYSSVMDLDQLDKKCMLVPTPGQTEQEYLAQRMSQYSNVRTCVQSALSITKVSELIKELQ